jgi:DNA-binding transcriptional ArsR family regulator
MSSLSTMDKLFYQRHAQACASLANPTRLQILDGLRDGEVSVSELAERVGIRMPTLSQHLALMRRVGVVANRREGTTVYYRIANLKVIRAYDLMTEVILEHEAAQRRSFAVVQKRIRSRHSSASG